MGRSGMDSMKRKRSQNPQNLVPGHHRGNDIRHQKCLRFDCLYPEPLPSTSLPCGQYHDKISYLRNEYTEALSSVSPTLIRNQTPSLEQLRPGHEQGLELWDSGCQNWEWGGESARERSVRWEQSRRPSWRKGLSTELQES